MAEEVLAQRIQDAFVLLAIKSTKFLQACRQSVRPEYFSSEITESIIRICYQYFDQFKTAPDNHFHDDVARFLSDKEESEITHYMEYLGRIQDMETPHEGYVISRINSFIKASELKTAAIKFAKLIAEGEFEKGQILMHTALKIGIQKEEEGIDYLAENLITGFPAYYLENTSCERLMGTGFKFIDDLRPRGLCRTDLVCILGSGKGKKSWSMIHMGKLALLHGLRVLHISHELSAEETEQRYDRAIGCLSKEQEPTPIVFPKVDEEGHPRPPETRVLPSVYDIKEVQKVRSVIRRLGGELIIKKYSLLTCTMDEIERYLNYLETYKNFTPDVVINDYPEKMKLPFGDYRRDGIHEIYMNMKRIAEERKQLWFTVSQVKRDALEKKVLSKGDFAEDIRKLEDVDLALAISHNKFQAANQRMQAFVLAARQETDSFGCCFDLQLDAGQFLINCWPIKMKSDEKDNEGENAGI